MNARPIASLSLSLSLAVLGLEPVWLVASERLHERAPFFLLSFLAGPWLALVVAFRPTLPPGAATTARLAAALLVVDVVVDAGHPYRDLVVHVPWEMARVAVVFAASAIAARWTPAPRAAKAARSVTHAVTFAFAATMVHLAIDGSRRDSGPADAALVLGFALDDQGRAQPSLVGRVEHAAELLASGRAPFVVASGGVERGGRTEAGVIRDLLRERGVADDRVVLDEAARSTIENFACSAPLLRARGARRVLLVTEPWHMTRAALLARRHAPELTFARAPASSATWRDPRRAAYWLFRDANGYLQELALPREPRPAPCPRAP